MPKRDSGDFSFVKFKYKMLYSKARIWHRIGIVGKCLGPTSLKAPTKEAILQKRNASINKRDRNARKKVYGNA